MKRLYLVISCPRRHLREAYRRFLHGTDEGAISAFGLLRRRLPPVSRNHPRAGETHDARHGRDRHHLGEIKERLPHGAWLPCLEAEFSWPVRTHRPGISI